MAGLETRQLLYRGLESRRRRRHAGRETAGDQASDLGLRQAQIAFQPKDRLMILYGSPVVSQVTLQAAGERALSGEPVVFLDAAHTFDSLTIGRFAKARRQQPRKVLALIHVARAFSWHQIERLVSHCLAGALERYEARTAVISGLFEALAEEHASDREIGRMSDRLVESIRDLTLKGCSLLCPCPSIPVAENGQRLFRALSELADRRIYVQQVQGKLVLEERSPVAERNVMMLMSPRSSAPIEH